MRADTETATCHGGPAWLRAGLDLLFPPLCMACRAPVAEAGHLCSDCWSAISFIDGPVCAACGLPFELDPGGQTLCAACHANPPAFDCARAVMRYDDAARNLILAFKWADRLDLSPGFARWLSRRGKGLLDEADLIVPVPLHRRRLWRRRYNQAAILAHMLARSGGPPCETLLLRRIRSTPSQGSMGSAKARWRNMRGAFAVRQGGAPRLSGRTVLVVDDVHTTGATLDACASALKKGGAARVFVLTLARVVRPQGAAL